MAASQLYHNQIKNMFSAGGASATNSPLAYLEEAANTNKRLLVEQSKANDINRRQLDEHTKLLKKLTKNTSDKLGLGDLILSRYITKFLSGVGGAITGVATMMLGRGKGLLVGGAALMFKGLPKLFKSFGVTASAMIGNALRSGMTTLSRVGKPLVGLFSKISAIGGSSGGLLKEAAALGTRITKMGGFAKILGKLAWPITALLGMIDGISGFMNADSLLGKSGQKLGIIKRLQVARDSVVNGLLFGLPDYFSKKFTGKGFVKLMDDSREKMYAGMKDFTKSFGMRVGENLTKLRDKFRSAWETMPMAQTMSNFGTIMATEISSLGSYLSSGFVKMFGKVKEWFGDIFDFSWLPGFGDGPAGPKSGGASPSSQSGGTKTIYGPYGPITIRVPTAPTPTLSPSLMRPDSIGLTTSSAAMRAQVGKLTVPMALGTLNTIQSSASSVVEQASGAIPPYMQGMYKDGLNIFSGYAAEMVKTHAAGVAAVTTAVPEQVAEQTEQSFAAMVGNVAKDLFSTLLKDIPSMAASQMGKIFNSENLSVLSSIIGGSASSADIGSMLSGITAGNAVPSWSAPPPGVDPNSTSSLGGAVPGVSVNNSQLVNDLRAAGVLTPEDEAKLSSGVMPGVGPVKVTGVTSAGAGWTQVKLEDGKTVTRKGLRSWRNNNPGNMEYNDYTKSLGAVGSDGRFAVFPDEATGNRAREKMLFEGKNYKDLTLAAAITRYAPPHENNTQAYINAVAGAAGIDPNTTRMRDLSPEKRNVVLAAMQKHEGWKPGKIYDEGGREIPPGMLVTQTNDLKPTNAVTALPGAGGIVTQAQDKLAGIRKQKIDPALEGNIAEMVLRTLGPGYRAEVYSGGQAPKGSGGRRTGSRRHDNGGAADLKIFGPDGKQITQADYARVGQAWLANNKGSVGLQMSTGGIHLDKVKKEDLRGVEKQMWTYNGKGIRVTPDNYALLQAGLSGQHPEYKLSARDAQAYLQAGKGTALEEKSIALADSPMFKAMNNRAPGVPIPTRRPQYGLPDTMDAPRGRFLRRSDILRTRSATDRAFRESGVGALPGEMMIPPGRPDVVGSGVKLPSVTQAVPSAAVRPITTQNLPQVMQAPPMKPNSPDINTNQHTMPSIETIPTVDELAMLMINSEALS